MPRALVLKWVARAALALPEQDRLFLAMALVASPLAPSSAGALRQLGEMATRRSGDLFDRELNDFLQREVSHDEPRARGTAPR